MNFFSTPSDFSPATAKHCSELEGPIRLRFLREELTSNSSSTKSSGPSDMKVPSTARRSLRVASLSGFLLAGLATLGTVWASGKYILPILRTAQTMPLSVGAAQTNNRLLVRDTQPRLPPSSIMNVDFASTKPNLGDGKSSYAMNSLKALDEVHPAIVSGNFGRSFVDHRVGARSYLNGLGTKPDFEIVQLLKSVQTRIRAAARTELQARGWQQCSIEFAVELAQASELRRLELIRQIGDRPELNPKPWMLWMASEGQPSVRIAATRQLEGLLDLATRQSLRLLLEQERDSQVCDAMRQVLESTGTLEKRSVAENRIAG